MMLKNLGDAPLLLFLLLVLVGCLLPVTQADDSDDVCKRVQANSDQKSLLCVGKMRSTLLIITMDFHVYQIPMSTVNGTLSQLYLGDYKAEPLSKKWPKLYADARFQQLLKHRSMLLDVYTCVDNYDEYVLFETDKENEANAIMYGLNTHYVGTGTAYQLSDTHLSFISSESMNDFYQLTKTPGSENGDMTLMRWHFNLRPGDKGIRSVAPRHGKAASPDLPHDNWYRICAEGSDKLTVQRNRGAPCKGVNWPILTGFVANKHFYLFGKSYVFVFSEEAYSTSGANVDLKQIPYNEFIRCGGGGQGRLARLAKRSPVKFGLIVAGILIAVLLFLCCLLCLIREALKRRNKKGRHGRKGSKGGGSWNPLRSTGLVGFGMLTKKPTPSQNKLTPGTKRSAGGLVPGRSLSRRGAPETKRSLAIGASGTHLTGVPFTKRSAPVGGGDTSPSATKLGRGVSMDRSGSRNITRRSSHAKTHSRKPSATNRATERSGLKKR